MSRLTVTVDVYFTADNTEEATQEVAKIMEDLDVSLEHVRHRARRDADQVARDPYTGTMLA
jgi:hypothetical protein